LLFDGSCSVIVDDNHSTVASGASVFVGVDGHVRGWTLGVEKNHLAVKKARKEIRKK
jgi:hypothetical protein